MDLNQTKLSRSEWQSIEIAVNDDEKRILNMIMEGYSNGNICVNDTVTLYTNLKIPRSEEMDYYLYKNQLEPVLLETINTIQGVINAPVSNKKKITSPYSSNEINLFKENLPLIKTIEDFINSVSKIKCKQPNKSDLIRISTIKQSKINASSIYEFYILNIIKNMLYKKKADALFEVYTFIQLKKNNILNINKYIQQLADTIIDYYLPNSKETILSVFKNAKDIIEKNKNIIQYEDITLYPHQKKLFEIFRENNSPKLVLYMAPTGTGKTLSPIGLSQQYRIIFVCVARHVGLALAKSAISVHKRVAFAFGCDTASDIRLHYFAASDYKINKRSGGIGKVDNSVGDKVEIMICDVSSYLIAMNYMLAFNSEQSIVTYWDEPTITMDYETHELHETISNNWQKNKISKVVLSCATLPKMDEIEGTLHGFRQKFNRPADPEYYDEFEEYGGATVYGYMAPEDEDIERIDADVHVIDSYDCKKSISLVNKEGHNILPHLLFGNFRDLIKSMEHCEKNKTLLRYFDISEIIRLVEYVCEQNAIDVAYLPENYFKTVGDINMKSIKLYYMEFIRNIDESKWSEIYAHLKSNIKSRFYNPAIDLKKFHSVDSSRAFHVPTTSAPTGSITRTHSVCAIPSPTKTEITSISPISSPASLGILLTTQDAHTLTDGPSIYLAEDVDKIGKFYIQNTKIPEAIHSQIIRTIDNNNAVRKSIEQYEALINERMESKGAASGDKKGKDKGGERMDNDCIRWSDKINELKENIKSANLPQIYIPNTHKHQEIWVPSSIGFVPNAFVPRVDDSDVKEIMELDVETNHKLLLILGIGVFSLKMPQEYMEIMKRLASTQKLFLIIASSDYIYGTNYQFCHGIIGKDLTNMTQQKTIQALGRIGRNNIQNDYSLRFRDDSILENLFKPATFNMEAVIMNRLFM